MRRRPTRSTRTATLFPYTPLCRSPQAAFLGGDFDGEVHTLQTRPGGGLVGERFDVEPPLRIVRDHDIGRALQADHAGQGAGVDPGKADARSEEHTSELQSLMRKSYAVFCLKKKNNNTNN